VSITPPTGGTEPATATQAQAQETAQQADGQAESAARGQVEAGAAEDGDRLGIQRMAPRPAVTRDSQGA
jgi:hypothetical protein